MQNRYCPYLLNLLFILSLLYSCSSPGPGIFGKKTPHQEYEKKIKDAGLKETALGEAWLRAAAITLSSPLDISLPYSETGYFADDRANGIGLRFRARRGQKLKISLTKKPAEFYFICGSMATLPCFRKQNTKIYFSRRHSKSFFRICCY